jgi:hypothetical protein
MTDRTKLTLVRLVHNLVYVVMAGSVFAMLYAGITGARGPWLGVAILFAVAEAVVYAVNGMRCPLTLLARKYGADPDKGYAMDRILSGRAAARSFTFLTAVGVVGLVLVLLGGWSVG